MGEKSSLKFDGESSCFTLPLRIFVFFVVPEGNSTAEFRINETRGFSAPGPLKVS